MDTTSTTVRRHLREVRAALRVVLGVLATLVLAALHAGRVRTPELTTQVADARSLVVLVHGFGVGPDCWDTVADALGLAVAGKAAEATQLIEGRFASLSTELGTALTHWRHKLV